MRLILSIIETIIFWLVIPLIIISFGTESTTVTHAVSWTVAIFGVILVVYSILAMLFHSGGMPYYFYGPEKLVISGPYRFVRHPIYLGYLLVLAGLVMAYWSHVNFFLFSAITILVVLYTFLFEEKKLKEKLDGYKDYAKKVPAFIPLPGKFIPFEYTRCVPWQYIFLNLLMKFLVQFIVWPKVLNGKVLKSRGPFVLAILHQTHYDGPLIYYAVTRYFRFVSTALYFDRIPLMWKVGIIPVKRYTVDFVAMKRIIETIRNGFSIGIAPEAARTWDGERICIRKEIWKLLRKLDIPVIPVKFYGIQRLWPRWSDKIKFGRATVEFGEPVIPEDPHFEEKIKDFLSKPDPSFELPYRDYKGIEKLLWRCPDCGTIGSVKSKKHSFWCSNCGTKYVKPTVNEVIELHKRIRPDKMPVNFPIEDNVILNGRTVRGTLYENRFVLGDLVVNYDELRTSSIERNEENIFGTSKALIRFIPKISPLMWKEIVDYQVRFVLGREDFHTYYWDIEC
ncbi:1-acyl-sn-glycerol-3-phosphate acyltransferase [Kosmotoga pacifica]|uniref:Phospholipid/glycerol acyltransferase domain-containing protein n=1 Tax=Kosmotoga pacifica TaxID=1330330 RepID=A0A0G2ZCL4_9BACT|nr:1-acyl-sn-glycerol-3-phosphate acyltransferase [Kosmotoga pacifica]AKI97289.1 hypothetical protein IX53_05070 [Kosmotoga pacifica]